MVNTRNTSAELIRFSGKQETMMLGVFEKFWSFLNYWYFRYMLVTELYMVEKWERYMIHVFLLILFGLLFIFNSKILAPSVLKYCISL